MTRRTWIIRLLRQHVLAFDVSLFGLATVAQSASEVVSR